MKVQGGRGRAERDDWRRVRRVGEWTMVGRLGWDGGVLLDALWDG